MRPLLAATNNPGKLRELRRLAAPLQLVSPRDLGLSLDVEETGATFAENAELKARAWAAAANAVTLADDSGLEVDALDGGPGVLSARFGGPGLDDLGRCDLILEQVRHARGQAQRRARFRCCVVAAAPDGRSCAAEGTCEGLIARDRSGDGGFGYDPIFLLPAYGRTMAEVDAAVKDRLSHRAAALAALLPNLLRTFPELSL